MKNKARPVPLFDIPAQHKPLQPKIQAAVRRVLDSCHFVLGQEGAAFEQEFSRTIGAGRAVGVSSGTSALHLAVLALGLRPGDAVMTVPLTFIGTTIGILSAGAQVRFCDVDPESLTLDPVDAARRLTSDVKALMPVHLYGWSADMRKIIAFAARKKLKVIEDCAQAHLSTFAGKRVGTFGDIGCFSFYVSKNLGAAGDAGACLTKNQALERVLRMLRNNGSDPVEKYRHLLKGYNARLDEIQAAVLRVKLNYLERWTEERRKRARIYFDLLSDLPLILPPKDRPGQQHTYHLFVIRVRERQGLQDFLSRRRIATAVYYPIPLHLQPAYRDLGYGPGDFPVSEQAANEVLALPVAPEIPLGQVRFTAKEIRRFFKGAGPSY